MEHTIPEDFTRLPVDRFARFLMVSAKENPALIRRSGVEPGDDLLTQIKGLPALIWRGSLASAQRHGIGPERETYLEELTALAITAVGKADDAIREAREIGDVTRRGRLAWSAIGALGVAFGVASISLGAGRGVRPASEALHILPSGSVTPSGEVRAASVLFAARRPFARPLATDLSPLAAVPVAPPAAVPVAPPVVGPAMPDPQKAIYVRPLPVPPNAVPVPSPPLRTAAESRPTKVGRHLPRPVRVRTARPLPAPLSELVYTFQRNIDTLFR